MKKEIIAILLFGCFIPTLFAADQTELESIQGEIEIARSEIQKSTTSFLLIAKQIGQDQPLQTEQFVRVTGSGVSVYESDLETAPLLINAIEGDEFLLIERRNDWLKIELGDSREGWILRNSVQIIDREFTSSSLITVDLQVMQITEQLYHDILNQYEQAEQLFEEFEEVYDNLSSTDKTEDSPIYSAYLNEREKIQIYKAYADHFYKKFRPIRSAPTIRSTQNEIGYEGTASLRLGTASYKSMTEQSTTSRNVNLNGAIIFSPQSRLRVKVDHNNDVVQTPYTSNNVNLIYQHRTAGGTNLNGSVLYNSYTDEAADRNNFNNLGIGANIDHPLNTNTRIFGDIHANSKSFDVEGGNEFDAAHFNSGLNYNSDKTQASLGVRGRLQRSDVSFLDYFRVIPNANIRWLTNNGKSFGIRVEAEQLAYSTEAEGNNFNRGRVDLQWTGSAKSTSLTLIAKQFPNNEAFDNYRFRLRNEWRKTSGFSSKRTAFSVQYVYHPDEATQLTDYIDLRLDKNNNGEKAYFDLNVFGRYWNETERDHRVDIFSRFGFKFSRFQVGPAVGAQLLLNQDDLQIERNGNSFRLGLDARVNAAIQKAIIYGNFRYQKSLVYSSEITINTSTGLVTEGDLQSRIPTTIQFSAGIQVPLIDALDFKIDASYYNVDLDISDEISINPVQSRTGLRVLGGISYRFQK